MKQMIAYDTTTGEILSVMAKDVDLTSLSSGTGSLAENILDSVDLGGHSSSDVDRIQITTQRRSIPVDPESWLSDTKVRVSFQFSSAEVGDADYELFSVVSASQYTDDEKNDFVAQVKSDVGHDNVDVKKVTAPACISPDRYVVDLDTGNVKYREFVPE